MKTILLALLIALVSVTVNAQMDIGTNRYTIFQHQVSFLYASTNGIKKTIHAIKKRILPMNEIISPFIKLDARKKMAQIIKSIQPTN